MIPKKEYISVVAFICMITAFLAFDPHVSLAQTITTSPTQSPTPTKAPQKSPIDDTIESLKEKIEDKVEEINQSTKKIIRGTVEAIKGSDLTIESSDGSEYTVSVDETVTTVSSISTDGIEEASQEDIEVDSYVLVTGPIIEDQVSANAIYLQDQYTVLQGQITAVDSTAFTVDIVTQAKDQLTLDIESDTVQSIMDSKTLEITKSGFSKFKSGDRIHAVILNGGADSKTVAALRTFIIPQEYFSVDTISPAEE